MACTNASRGNTTNKSLMVPDPRKNEQVELHAQEHSLHSTPLSALVTAPTCFMPFGAITFPGFCTVVSPVSSIFNRLTAVQNGSDCKGSPDCHRTSWHWFWLKLEIRLSEVASGVLKDTSLQCLRINPENQSSPADSVIFHISGTGFPRSVAN